MSIGAQAAENAKEETNPKQTIALSIHIHSGWMMTKVAQYRYLPRSLLLFFEMDTFLQ